MTDTLSGLNSGSLNLTGPLEYLSGSRGSNSDVILVNEQANYRASFTINQEAVDFGGLRNVVTAQAVDDAQSGTTQHQQKILTLYSCQPLSNGYKNCRDAQIMIMMGKLELEIL